MRLVIDNKILFSLVGLMLLNLTGMGQYVHFSNLHENLFYYNPAAIHNNEHLTFHGHYRNQWPGTSDFVNYSGSVLYNPNRYKSSFGISAFRDVQGQGIITQTNISGLYGYQTRIGRKLILATGITLIYSRYATNFGQLQFENNTLPSSISNQRQTVYNFSTGFELQHNNDRYGLSLINGLSLQSSQPNTSEPGINLYYTTRIKVNSSHYQTGYTVEPIFNTSFYKNNTILSYGGRIDMNTFIGGLYLRQNWSFQYDAIIILLGTRFGNSSLFYTYDVNLSKVGSQFTSLAAHEVTFLQNLEYKRKSRKKGAIKCPNI